MQFYANLASLAGEYVLYEGKVFEAGEYPDKEFAISQSELADRVSRFAGVDLDLEHSPFRDLLGHRLGRLEAIRLDGKRALGRLLIPRWLHNLCGGTLQTSLSFDTAKNIVGCALTLHPRIPDAQIAAAFSRQLTPPFSLIRKEIHPMPSSLKERLRVLFSKAPEAVEEAGIDLAELDAEMPVNEPPSIDPAIAAQLTEFRATNDRLASGQLTTLATLFADEIIRNAKAVPAQRDNLIALYKSASIADGKGTVHFSEDGSVTAGPNLTALEGLFKDAVPHTLFNTQIPNADPNADSPDGAMLDRLRGASSLGRQTIKKEAN